MQGKESKWRCGKKAVTTKDQTLKSELEKYVYHKIILHRHMPASTMTLHEVSCSQCHK